MPETARRATYMDFSISLNFNFDFFSLLCRDYFVLRILRMADVNVTLRYMHGVVKKLYQPIHRRKFLICHTDPDRTSVHRQIHNVCTQMQIKSPDRVPRLMQIIKHARMERKLVTQTPTRQIRHTDAIITFVTQTRHTDANRELKNHDDDFVDDDRK